MRYEHLLKHYPIKALKDNSFSKKLLCLASKKTNP